MCPNFGYLCLFENPTAEAGRALTRQFVLVREADRMGYDSIWLGEQHFDGVWPTGGALSLLGHLSGVTSHARIGPIGLLTPFRNPVQLAEEIATLDLLSKGRLHLGVSRGGPFPAQNLHFGVDEEQAAARALEALELITQLLSGERVSFSGRYYQVEDVQLAARPAQPEVPTWIATTSEATLMHAARVGAGLIAGATSTPARLHRMLATYRAGAAQSDPKLVLARFCFVAKTRAEALAVAQPYFHSYCERMRNFAAIERPGDTFTFEPDALLALSLVGSYDEVTERIAQLQSEFALHTLALIPTSAQFDTVKHCLADLVDEVRPQLMED